MKIHIKIMLLLILGGGLFGFVLPYLISAKSDIAVLAGVATFIISIPIFWYLTKSMINDMKLLIKKSNQKE